MPASQFSDPAATGVYAAVPESVRGDLGLALGFRCGFATEPLLPFEDSDRPIVARDVRSAMLRFAVGGSASAKPRDLFWYGTGPAVSVLPENVRPFWKTSSVGTLEVGPGAFVSDTYVVVGDSEDDFALAVALDRMLGGATWIPSSFMTDDDDLGAVALGLMDLTYRDRNNVGQLIYTSVSLSHQDVVDVYRTIKRNPSLGLPPKTVRYGNPSDPPVYADPLALDLSEGHFLACGDHDYDVGLPIPGIATPIGDFTLATPVPVRVPRSPSIANAGRPFWEVDFYLANTMPPKSRSVPSREWMVDDSTFESQTWIRSSKAGISFHAQSMGLVTSSQSLEQSVAQPRLHIPGLFGWLRARTKWSEPSWEVAMSDAGRRAQVLARLLGGRQTLLETVRELQPLFRAFLPATTASQTSYPLGDGVCLSGRQGLLRFDGACRALVDSHEPEAVRARLDHLLERGILSRGLVLLCSDCGVKSFYSVDSLGQFNTCPRCGGRTPLKQTQWRQPTDEPQWFYDIHGALRQLLQLNGDVPILAAAHLLKGARGFDDLPEIDFIKSSRARVEIDLLAHVTGRVIVGEAKKNASLGVGRERSKAVDKLTSIAQLVHADEILLATTADGPWAEADVKALHDQLRSRWRIGKVPTVRTVTNLGASDGAIDSFGS